MTHLDGIPWWQAERPRANHDCWTQTDGWTESLHHIERCACGGVRMDGGPWMERNTR